MARSWRNRAGAVALLAGMGCVAVGTDAPPGSDTVGSDTPSGSMSGSESGTSSSVGVPPDDVSVSLEEVRAAYALPALAAAIWVDGRIAAQGVAGLRSVGAAVPAEVDDRWHLGSCTKAMTATLAALLVEDGVIEWETRAADVFDDVDVDEGYANTTLEDLLGNRGGLPASTPSDLWNDLWDLEVEPTAHRQRFSREILQRPAAQPVGTYAYANGGFVVAGAMMETATGKSWEELTVERIFEPLGMASCGFGPAATPGTIDGPYGHTATLQPVLPGPEADNAPALGPAGTVHCSMQDWLKFLAIHVRGSRGEEGTFLPDAAYERMHTPGDQSYALGWYKATNQPWAGSFALTHSGSNTLNYAVTWVAPDRDAILVSVSNRAGTPAAQGTNQALIRLIEGYLAP
jgi:D-alanyl-D-alanine carboxypeptidase